MAGLEEAALLMRGPPLPPPAFFPPLMLLVLVLLLLAATDSSLERRPACPMRTSANLPERRLACAADAAALRNSTTESIPKASAAPHPMPPQMVCPVTKAEVAALAPLAMPAAAPPCPLAERGVEAWAGAAPTA